MNKFESEVINQSMDETYWNRQSNKQRVYRCKEGDKEITKGPDKGFIPQPFRGKVLQGLNHGRGVSLDKR